MFRGPFSGSSCLSLLDAQHQEGIRGLPLRDELSVAPLDLSQDWVTHFDARPRGIGEPCQALSPWCSNDASGMMLYTLGAKPLIPYADLLGEVLSVINLPDLLVQWTSPTCISLGHLTR